MIPIRRFKRQAMTFCEILGLEAEEVVDGRRRWEVIAEDLRREYATRKALQQALN